MDGIGLRRWLENKMEGNIEWIKHIDDSLFEEAAKEYDFVKNRIADIREIDGDTIPSREIDAQLAECPKEFPASNQLDLLARLHGGPYFLIPKRKE